MSTPTPEDHTRADLVGELTHAGTMNVGSDTDVTGVFVCLTVEELRAVKTLPMYRRVAIIPADEIANLRAQLAALQAKEDE